MIDARLAVLAPERYPPPIRAGRLFVAADADRIIGFGEASPGRVIVVYVDPDDGRLGIGSTLLARAASRARARDTGPVELEAALNAVGFHERRGFVRVAEATVRRSGTGVPTARMVPGTPRRPAPTGAAGRSIGGGRYVR